MPLHDWTRVDAGIFHAFHLNWIAELTKALNGGILPRDYYALGEQHAGDTIGDLLTLHAMTPKRRKGGVAAPDTAVLEPPPRVARKLSIGEFKKGRRRTLAIRHVSDDRLIALLEIDSPANKDRPAAVKSFVNKIENALQFGIHALILDLFPPGNHDLCGMHGAIWQRLERTDALYDLPDDNCLTLASYVASTTVDIYLEHPAVGESLADMPLFLSPAKFVYVPLESTYQEAYRAMPRKYRDVLAG